MGTFHQDRGDLHGITVVVETSGDVVYIGRCDIMDERQIVLQDVDVHGTGEGQPERSKEDFIREAAQKGVWARHKRITLPMDSVTSVSRLGEVSFD